jgi:hypothetical protein
MLKETLESVIQEKEQVEARCALLQAELAMTDQLRHENMKLFQQIEQLQEHCRETELELKAKFHAVCIISCFICLSVTVIGGPNIPLFDVFLFFFFFFCLSHTHIHTQILLNLVIFQLYSLNTNHARSD